MRIILICTHDAKLDVPLGRSSVGGPARMIVQVVQTTGSPLGCHPANDRQSELPCARQSVKLVFGKHCRITATRTDIFNGENTMASDSHQEPAQELSAETRDMHRALTSLREEL